MGKSVALLLLLAGASGLAVAVPPVPEISPASGVSAIALLSGALLMIRSRRKSGRK